MTEPKLNHVSCPGASAGNPEGTHRMAYWQWGRRDAPHVLVCVHGLSRQGRDFDVLARALLQAAGGESGDLRIVCPDIVGRGRSDWLADPMGYQIPLYAADMAVLLGALKPVTLDWLGTSMGGLIGLALLGQAALQPTTLPAPIPIRKLVLNDVGPVIAWAALQRIGTYLGAPMRFDTVEQAAEALRLISVGFGPHTREQWLELSRPMLKPVPAEAGKGAGYVLHCDPAIAAPYRLMTPETAAAGEALLWQMYEAIQADTLLLRGKDSDLLSVETAQAMAQRGPRARLVEFEGVGHAPTLIADDQVRAVRSFLLGS
ncbi:alpha/beta hydrolase [Hylemonella gracilis]|jgi:pimeloyl-ACP methyl ester carboxylesterase|uniref:Alpha/beta hydrolase n=1 Tax=Hylemonella gracilis TaxID=80880 RepID=A0A4P6UN86_9BURK|nr:alpha/beta hydrolase [Hylemonella gracilis]QBK05555.1 alpha/beta hydrolase [Hylemonella gracilis]